MIISNNLSMNTVILEILIRLAFHQFKQKGTQHQVEGLWMSCCLKMSFITNSFLTTGYLNENECFPGQLSDASYHYDRWLAAHRPVAGSWGYASFSPDFLKEPEPDRFQHRTCLIPPY